MKDYKLLSSKIYDRMSVREYSYKKVDFFEDGTDLAAKFGLVPLFKDIRCKIVMLKDGEEVKNGRSKYCIGFFSETTVGYLENVGFLGQQLSLELQALGIGTCWWGMKKPARAYRNSDGLEFVISMSAGYPEGALTRTPDGFKRNTLDEIALKEKDDYIDAVRFAPSAVNNQPWLVEKNGSSYNFYLSKPKSIVSRFLIADMRKIDMGIGISHLYIKAKADGLDAEIKANGQNLTDAVYIATLTLK
ncbi:MAG: hypothetical protein LBT30_04255 [Clostridiales bacterium]|jgi:hypothetical protein|nr:hypothetical protein [Clostridiales bacterium]